MAATNERKNVRVFLAKKVGISFANHPKNFYPTRNISLSGIFIDGKFWQNPGNTCAITLTERWSNREYVMTLAGKVARQDEEGIAIQFTEMHRETLSLLQTLLIYESVNPTSMGEEFAHGCTFAVSDHAADATSHRVLF